MLKNRFVLNDNIDITHYKKATKTSILFGPLLYLCGAALSLVHTYLGFCVCIYTGLFYLYNSAKTR